MITKNTLTWPYYGWPICLLLTFLLVSTSGYSQITITPNTAFAQCAGYPITYTVDNAITNNCQFEWTVTNGTIQGGFQNGNVSTFTGGNLIIVTWSDISSGSIHVKARDCSPPATTEATFNYAILSVKGVTPSSISSNNPNPTVSITNNVTYTIDKLNYPKLGTAEITKEVDSYEWEIPVGWTVVSGGTTHSITVKPDNCSGGTIRVRGKSTECPGFVSYSNWSPVRTITRTIATPGAIAGADVVYCFDSSVKQYSVSTVAGATSYIWTTPWWSGTTTSPLIDLTPNGAIAGTISVKAQGCGIESAASPPKTITLLSYDPSKTPQITPDIVCSSTTFTLTNHPAGPAFTWTSSNPNGLSINASSGVANRVSNFIGKVTITATRPGPEGCALTFTKDIIVGPPQQFGFIDGPGMMTDFNILYVYTLPPTGATSYTWSVNNSNLARIRFDSNTQTGMSVSLQRNLNQEGVVNISLAQSNACGSSTIGPRPVRVGPCPGNFNNTGCGQIIERTPANEIEEQISIFPNPTAEELNIQLKEFSGPATLTLLNGKSEIVHTEQTDNSEIKIPVAGLPDGYYIIKIKQSNQEVTKTIQVKH